MHMALIIEDLQRERLAPQIAMRRGASVTEVVRESLLSPASLRGLTAKKPSLRERLAALACEVDALPPRHSSDGRSGNDILGYDEHGAW
jgi:hypothetical protein